MAASQLSEVVQHLRRSVLEQEGPGLTDGQLLGCFIAQRDDAAFAALVRRHGPMVWGVCRRLLEQHDAEDAFQATFLVLVRKAASIVSRERVGNWLYGVAHQTALQARRNITRRRAREKQVMDVPEPAVAQQDLWRDLQPLLDQELSQLPDAYREVIVLSDLEGKTRKEVARQLGLPEGTVGSRLARARTILAKRLTRQGVTSSGGALAAVLSQQVALAHVPASVVDSTIKAASLLTAGKVAATGAISLKVAALTEGVLKTILLTKLKAAIAVVALLGFVATVTTVLACRRVAEKGDKPPAAEKPVKTPEKPESVGGEASRKKTEAARGLKLTLSADKTETVLKPGTFYGAVPVKLKLTFTNTGDKPVKLDAYALPYRIKFQCDGPGPDSVKKLLVYVDMAFNPPTEKDYPVLQPGKSWSPGWTPAFPGDIPDGVGTGAAYSLRQPGTYKLRMTVYDNYAPHVEGAAPGTKLVESNELELKVHEKAPSGKKAANEQYRVRVFRSDEKDPAGPWQLIYLDQVVPLGAPFDVRDKSDRTAAKGVLQRTRSGQLHFKGSISAFHCNAVAIDAPVELGKPIKAKGGIGGMYLSEDLGSPKYGIFVCFERSMPERPGDVKLIKRTSAVHEKIIGRVFPKRAEMLVVPGPRPQKQALSQWIQSRLKADNVLTADQETWVLFRSQAMSDHDRMSIERIEQQGNLFIVTMNYTPYLGPLWRNAMYHEVHGINLGKLPAGDYTVKWMIGSFSRDGRTEELKSPDGWQEMNRSFNVLALKVREKYTLVLQRRLS